MEPDTEADPTVVSFSSREEMEEYMRRKEEEADAHISDRQREITWGTYGVRVDRRAGLVIFTKVWTQEEARASSVAAGASEEEADWEARRLVESHERNYRFGQHFSTVCPEGEIGSCHVVSMWPITEEDFNRAKDDNWLLRESLAVRLTTEVAAVNNDGGAK